ncbi:hypothetical protein IMZ48_46180 [Candidatus Bathyarchaeota archaeon]|nr:hypothetical protein [Candidatus Bathyarchaeota archaeon]
MWFAVDDGEGLDFRLRSTSRFTQGSDLDQFIDAFLDALSKDSQSRSRDLCKQPSPGKGDVILDDDVVRRIGPTVRRIAPSFESCFGDKYQACRDIIPDEERKASAFQREGWTNPCGKFLDVNGPAFYSMEIFNILLLNGEIDAALRICTSPGTLVNPWWEVPECYCAVTRRPHRQCCCETCHCDVSATRMALARQVEPGLSRVVTHKLPFRKQSV